MCQLSRERLVHVDYNGSVDKYNTRLHSLRWQYIESLFKTSDYNRALLQCKEGISDPLLVISLFAGLAPDGVNLALEHNSSKGNSATKAGSPRPTEERTVTTHHENAFASSFDNKAITSLLIPYLLFVRGLWKQEVKLERTANKNNNKDSFAIDRTLESSGRRITLKQMVDTCLLTAYVRTNFSTEKIRQFYVDDSGLGCDCLVKEMEALYRHARKVEELVWLYYNNDFHQKALDWLGETETAKIQPPYPSIRQGLSKQSSTCTL